MASRATRLAELFRAAQEADSTGSISYADFVNLALYHPEVGFYALGGGPTGRRDFITSVEMGSLFGECLARFINARWVELGCPEPFVILEGGAAGGSLARVLLRSGLPVMDVCSYAAVEASEWARSACGEVLRSEGLVGTSPDSLRPGCFCTAANFEGFSTFDGVVIANELLDNIGFRVAEATVGGWSEVRLCLGDSGITEVLGESLSVPIVSTSGSRVPLIEAGSAWVGDAVGLIDSGSAVFVDYFASTVELAGLGQNQWLRTYKSNSRAMASTELNALQDITIQVPVDQLPAAEEVLTQAEFLTRWGIEDAKLVASETSVATAALGNLEHLKARARLSEAQALLDPDGLGGFRVVIYHRESGLERDAQS